MSLAARLGQAAVILIILAAFAARVYQLVQRRRRFLEHLRRLQEP